MSHNNTSEESDLKSAVPQSLVQLSIAVGAVQCSPDHQCPLSWETDREYAWQELSQQYGEGGLGLGGGALGGAVVQKQQN